MVDGRDLLEFWKTTVMGMQRNWMTEGLATQVFRRVRF